MAQWKTTVAVKCPKQDVFAFILDPAQASKWHAGSSHTQQVTAGEVGIGTQYQVTMNVLGGQREVITEITRFELNQAVTFKAISGTTPFVMRYQLESTEIGTQLTEFGAVALVGVMKLFTPFITIFSSRNSKHGLRRLKLEFRQNRPKQELSNWSLATQN